MTFRKRIKEWMVWYLPSWKTIFGWASIILIFSVIALLIHGNPFEDLNKKNRYQGIASDGIIVNIERKEYLSQDETGNKIRTLGYIVEYTYDVSGKVYFGTKFLNKSKIHSKKLEDFMNGNYEIRYLLSEPNESIIVQK